MAQTPNPYGNFLDGRDPRASIAETPAKLNALASRLTGQKADTSYAPGKWTAREILAHLADCEIAFGFRLRQAAAEASHMIQPFDQDAWAAHYREADLQQAAQVFGVLRGWNVAFVKQQGDGILSKPLTHPERGTMTFATVLETMAGHDVNHLQQLETIAGQS